MYPNNVYTFAYLKTYRCDSYCPNKGRICIQTKLNVRLKLSFDNHVANDVF